MTALLIVSMLGIALLGYAVMCRVDRFIESGGIVDSPQGRVNQGALIYGAPEIAQKIREMGIKCRVLSDPTFPEDGLYSALFALSASDDENLTLCRSAKNSDPGIYLIVRCNEIRLYEIFEVAGADRILGAGEPIDSLIAELWGAGG